jgi:hypothetical protein
VSERQATNAFDWLGDWGGLEAALGLLFAFIGSYYSGMLQKLFIA